MSGNREQRPSDGPRDASPRGSRPFYTPGAGGFRHAVERRSAVPLVWLHQAPRWILPAAMAGVLLGGLLLEGIPGAALLVLLAVFIGWLAFLAWPALSTGQRTLRCAALVVLVGLALARVGLF